jgi:hypothetical protein
MHARLAHVGRLCEGAGVVSCPCACELALTHASLSWADSVTWAGVVSCPCACELACSHALLTWADSVKGLASRSCACELALTWACVCIMLLRVRARLHPRLAHVGQQCDVGWRCVVPVRLRARMHPRLAHVPVARLARACALRPVSLVLPTPPLPQFPVYSPPPAHTRTHTLRHQRRLP